MPAAYMKPQETLHCRHCRRALDWRPRSRLAPKDPSQLRASMACAVHPPNVLRCRSRAATWTPAPPSCSLKMTLALQAPPYVHGATACSWRSLFAAPLHQRPCDSDPAPKPTCPPSAMAPLTEQQIADCKEAFALFDQVRAARWGPPGGAVRRASRGARCAPRFRTTLPARQPAAAPGPPALWQHRRFKAGAQWQL
jgi:hypothetical protein